MDSLRGYRSVDVIGRVIGQTRLEEALRWFAAVEADPTDNSPAAAAGAAELLTGLLPDRWAIVSSGSSDLIRNRLTGAGLPHPDVIVSADDVARGKPDPEGYLLGAAPGWLSAEVTVVEDAAVGVAAGLAAGSTVIAVATTHPAAKLRSASVTVADLTGLSVEASGEFLIITARQD